MTRRDHFGALAVLAGLLVFAAICGRPAHATDFTVTNTKDSGAGSLRQTVGCANTSCKRAVLNPRANLAPGATYTAKVTKGARDMAGNPLEKGKVWKFAVQ